MSAAGHRAGGRPGGGFDHSDLLAAIAARHRTDGRTVRAADGKLS